MIQICKQHGLSIMVEHMSQKAVRKGSKMLVVGSSIGNKARQANELTTDEGRALAQTNNQDACACILHVFLFSRN